MAAYNAYSRDIDNDVLIAEVKARPALYDRTIKEYNDTTFKKSMWEEISEKLYPDVWKELSDTQKEIRGADVLKRWNNLRTCFTRELKIMKDPLQHKRRKYVYFDKLLFLIDENAAHFQEAEPSFVYTKSSSLDKFEEESHFSEKSPDPVEKKTTHTQSKKAKGKQARMKAEKKKNVEKYVQYSINKLKEELAYKNRTEDNVQVESMPKTFDTDAETNFALSLVPMLKMIPIDKKIDAQIELLSVLKKYTSKVTCEYSIIKYEKEDEQSDADDESEILSLYGDDK